jgi:hypothetical protein
MKTFRQILLWAAVIEIPTAVARFGLGLESTRDTAATVGKLTMGLRIHHGYIGVLLLLMAWWLPLPKPPSPGETAAAQPSSPPVPVPWRERLRPGMIVLGGALALSDLVHHFVVLWIFTGSPQFDLWYPR